MQKKKKKKKNEVSPHLNLIKKKITKDGRKEKRLESKGQVWEG